MDIQAELQHRANIYAARAEAARNNVPGMAEQAAHDHAELLAITEHMDEHPDHDGPCWCRDCRSYAAEDAT